MKSGDFFFDQNPIENWVILKGVKSLVDGAMSEVSGVMSNVSGEMFEAEVEGFKKIVEEVRKRSKYCVRTLLFENKNFAGIRLDTSFGKYR